MSQENNFKNREKTENPKKSRFNFIKKKMATQELRDSSNRLLGKIQTLSSGKMEIRDASNRLKGTYDPKSNETRAPSNRLVGKGNLLSSLL